MSRLVILTRKLDQGGAERQIVTLAKALKERGKDVQIVFFYTGGAFDHELTEAEISTHFIGKNGRYDVIRFLVRLVLILRRLQPATIYSFLDLPNVLSAFLYPVVGRPRLLWSIRAAGMQMHHYDWMSRLISKLEAYFSQCADVIVANSRAGKDWAISRKFRAERLVVIENGIDTHRFKFDLVGRERVRREWKIESCETVIGLVARIDVMKDHRNFLQAGAVLATSMPNLRFVCVGDGPPNYRIALESFAKKLGIADRVVWAATRSDMPAVHSSFDIACSSSSFGEGFSNAVAEAMACERPCVVTDVGDSARIVGDIGEVVPPRDSDAFARAISRLLIRVESNRDIGFHARARVVDKFSVDQMALRTEQLVFVEL